MRSRHASLFFVLVFGVAALAAVANPVRLGINVDDATIDQPGIVVREVTPGSSASFMGVMISDRLVSVNGTAINKKDDLADFMARAKLGDALTIEVERLDPVSNVQRRVTLRGTLEPVRSTVDTIVELKRQLTDAQAKLVALEAKLKKRNLAEQLQELAGTLKMLEEQLPAAAAAYKVQYPEGRFEFSFKLDISSDRNAASPRDLAAPATSAKSSTSANPASPATSAK